MVDTLIDELIKSVKTPTLQAVIRGLHVVRPPLIAQHPVSIDVKKSLDEFPVEKIFQPISIYDIKSANAVICGLYVWNDCMEEAHMLAQELSTAEGSYFHAIIHRREPDYWNSGYWFRQTGTHPIYSLVYDFALETAPQEIKKRIEQSGSWNPEVFNELCEEAVKSNNNATDILTSIQLAEIIYLIAHSYRHAIAR